METRMVLAILASGVVAMFTDWFFFGVLFHEKYKTNPEVWRRPGGGPGETKAVVLAMILGFLTSLVFVYLCYRVNFHHWATTWRLATGLWLMIPVPILVTQHLWVKIHPLTTLAHALGWLAKLLVIAAAVALIMGWGIR